MRTGKPLEEYFQEAFQADPTLEKDFYRELFRLRIGEQIRSLRHKKGLSQAELAKLIGTSQSTIARLENPDNFSVSLKTLLKIAEALDMEIVISFKEKEYKGNKERQQYEMANVVSLEEYRLKKKPPYFWDSNDNGSFSPPESSIAV